MMKKILVFLLLPILFACKEDKKKDKKQTDFVQVASTGRINHLIVIVEPTIWSGKAGKTLQAILRKPMKGLPQEEAPFTITTVPPKNFINMFQTSRNILILQKVDRYVFNLSTNVYAKPQVILEIKEKNEESLEQLILEKETEIINAFKNQDLKTLQEQHQKSLLKTPLKTFKKLKVSMNIPSKYRVVMDTLGKFVWLRDHLPGGIAVGDQTNNIIVYSVPMFDKSRDVLTQIIQNRDMIGEKFIRGDDEKNMYMITEKARTPEMRITTINGYKAYETRGTWEVFNAFNAGPFLNYAIVDEKNNRVLVVEGFNYAPSVKKRDFVFDLEAVLKTTKL